MGATMKVAVFGAGAVGGYLGARLAGGGADVSFIARGEHLDAMRERGLTLVTPEGERSTVAVQRHRRPRRGRAGRCRAVPRQVVRHGVRRPAPPPADRGGDRRALAPERHRQRAEDRGGRRRGARARRRRVHPRRDRGAGRRAQRPRPDRGRRAASPGRRASASLRFVEAANAGGIDAHAATDVRVAKWEKYVLLVAFSAVTAASQLTVGDIRGSEAASAMMRAIMVEAWSIGRALGIPLADDLVDRQHALVLRAEGRRGQLAPARPPDRPPDGARGAPGDPAPPRPRDRHRDAVDRRRLRDPPAVGDPERASRARVTRGDAGSLLPRCYPW